VWSDPFNLTFANSGIKAQIFDATGAKEGGEIPVRGASTPLFQDFSVVGLQDGGFAIAWDTYVSAQTNSSMRIYNADGTPRGAEFALPGGTAGDESFPMLAQLNTGAIVTGYSDDAGVTVGLVNTSGAFIAGAQDDCPGVRRGGRGHKHRRRRRAG
jgi:large repetitive protein